MKATRKVLTLAVLGAGLIAGVIVLGMWLMGGSERAAQANPALVIVGFDMNVAGNSCPNDCTDPGGAGHCTVGTDCTLDTIEGCVALPAAALDGKVNDGCPKVGARLDCDANCDGDCNDAGEDLLCDNNTDDDACDSTETARKINDGCPQVDCRAETSTQCANDTDDDPARCLDFDVFLDDLPDAESVLGFGYSIGEKTSTLLGPITACIHQDELVNLTEQPGSATMDMSDACNGTVTVPTFGANIADMGAAEFNPPFTQGTLGRYTLDLTGVGIGLYGLTLSNVLLGNDMANNLCVLYGCDLWDANHTPLPYGLIAVGQACPTYADLKKLDLAFQPAVSWTDYPQAVVSEDRWFTLTDTVHNNGPTDAVAAEVITVCQPPESIITAETPGGTCSYHVAATELVTVNGLLLNCTAPGALPVLCSQNCAAGVCLVGTVIEVEWPDVLDVHKSTTLATSVDEVLPAQEWDIHCYEPSTHTWPFDNLIVPTDPDILDPDLEAPCDPDDASTWGDCGNNAKHYDLVVGCTTTADLEAGTVTVTTVPATKAAVGELFDVTVSVNVINNGPWGPVNGDVTFGLTVPTDCTPTPANYKVENVSLPLGTTPVSHTWQDISCTSTGAHALGGSATVAVDQTHVSEKTPGNESSTGGGSISITSAADLHVVSWTFPDDRLSIDGYQVRVVPGVGVDRTIDSTEVLHNGGPYTPVHVDVVKTVSDADMDGGGVDCDIEPNAPATWNATLPLSPDQQDIEQFTIDWVDAVKPPYSCTFTFNKTLTITDADVGDPTPESPTRQVEAIRDTDGDTVVDRYATGSEDGAGLGSCNDGLDNGPDGSTDIDDPDCTLRERDNCQDDINPGQENVDGDALGDACDPDNDNDNIPDDWDGDTVLDDPCTGGETDDCDDNCRLIENPLQEDEESDGIGDVCELDVNCSGGGPNGADALMVLQRILGRVGLDPTQCPAPNGDLYAPRASAYVAYDPAHPELVGTGRDALMILQCLLGRHNIVCPED